MNNNGARRLLIGLIVAVVLQAGFQIYTLARIETISSELAKHWERLSAAESQVTDLRRRADKGPY